MKERICAVVVTYNRKRLLGECLDALLRQTRPPDSIIVIDNASSDGTEEFLRKDYLHNPVFDYVRLPQNIGGAGGFHEGIKRAYEGGCDWIWVMDDDVEADVCCLQNLLKYASESEILVPTRFRYDGNELMETAFLRYDLRTLRFRFYSAQVANLERLPDRLQIRTFAFEGPLFDRELISKIGFPRADFFIPGDDTEYAVRIGELTDSRPLLVRDARLYRKLMPGKYPEWKRYYLLRNNLIIRSTYGKGWLCRVAPFYVAFALVLKSLLCLRFRRAWYFLKGYVDYHRRAFTSSAKVEP